MRTTKTLLGAIATMALAMGLVPAHAQQAKAPLVVELYTSQGCSSCPPADKYLGELTKRPGVIALSFHVTYWNYLGWKDDLSTKAATLRQRIYRWSLGQSIIYTPQMVIHGRYPAVGSNRHKVSTYMRHISDGDKPSLTVGLVRKGGKLTVSLPAASWAAGKVSDVFLFLVDKAHTRKIGRGENAGRTITYHNVVREISRLGDYKGEALTFTASASGKDGAKRDHAVVVVQHRRVGPIIGAAMLALR